MSMKRASYTYGIQWIALNDSDGTEDRLDVEAISGYMSTVLLADLFGVALYKVAKDVLAYRLKQGDAR